MGSTPEYRVFISQGDQDRWIARQMGRRIREDSGALTFLDVDDVAVGDDFESRIHSEIRAARELVVLFTPWSARRSWVWTEVGAAWEQGKRVVAVLCGLSIAGLQETGEGTGPVDHRYIIQINDFDQYIVELSRRVAEPQNG